MADAAIAPRQQRLSVRVRGQVQGVGFRPFVYRLAVKNGLTGWVLNDGEGVEIQIQGQVAVLESFLDAVRQGPEPLARVDTLTVSELSPQAEAEFCIRESQSGPVMTGVAPDTAVCDSCLAELFDATDRRYRYPFITCTHCGPRYTITSALPYDRPNTSMANFELCPSCDHEYHDPADRRFHAQPNGCPACGPRVALADNHGEPIEAPDLIAETVARLQAGAIVAIKGLGGFHLVCDARNGEAVTRLRERKQRDEKPFAVMAAGVASIDTLVGLGDAERELLASAERPIVLLPKQPACDAQLPGVAPGLPALGVMLPYTPLHYLLLHEAAGRPAGTQWLHEAQDLLLVMTSANPGGEPLVIDNSEAQRRLAGIADAFLVHDRDIRVRCDDTVMRWQGTAPAFVRRARGFTPQGIRLPADGPSVLATGGWFKNTVCLTRGDQAFVSQHIGDLDNPATCSALEEAVDHLIDVLQVEPQAVAHDRHPDFFSSRFATAFADDRSLRRIQVQHHHAHAAAVCTEHGIDEPVLALALDGVGLGSDDTAWGGELLRVDADDFQRLGHLSTLALPGGDRAAREPWRMAAGVLFDLGEADEIEKRFPLPGAATVRQMLERGVNTPRTSSAGRLFDAAAGLLGLRQVSSYEAQAAIELEGAAAAHGPVPPMEDGFEITASGTLDFRALMAALSGMTDPGEGAALFHATFASGLSEWVRITAERQQLHTVVLAGGCLLNAILANALDAQISAAGLRVLQARRVPPSDGGLSLGQAWVALNRLEKDDRLMNQEKN